MLNLLYVTTLTSIHDYWQNQSFDYTDLCQQSDVSVFLIWCLGLLFFHAASGRNKKKSISVVSMPPINVEKRKNWESQLFLTSSLLYLLILFAWPFLSLFSMCIYTYEYIFLFEFKQYILFFIYTQFSSVQSLSRVQLFATPWTAARQASLSITNSQSLSKLMSIESVMPSNHLILCHPLFFLPSIFPSIRAFSNGQSIVVSASASILPMNTQD